MKFESRSHSHRKRLVFSRDRTYVGSMHSVRGSLVVAHLERETLTVDILGLRNFLERLEECVHTELVEIVEELLDSWIILRTLL